MSSRVQWVSLVAFLATFLWLLVDRYTPGPAALWPSVLAIGLAFLTRQIYLSLFCGAFAGAILLTDGNFFAAFLALFEKHLLPALADKWNLSVLVFTLLMGGLVGLLNAGGGMQALAAKFLGHAATKRRAGIGVFGLGLAIFIDGLANALLVGKSMRPVTDRAGMSREKLAFIVDSTSSPIAGLSLISTWVAYELSVIQQGFANAGQSEVAAFPLLVESLPYRFYNLFLLLIVFLVIWLGRDLGPMRSAERRTGKGETPVAQPGNGKLPGGKRPAPPVRAWPTVLCLIALVFGVFGALYFQGGGTVATFSLQTMIDAFGKADASLVFVWVTAATALLAMVLHRFTAAGSGQTETVKPFFDGMNQMFLPALILVFAWMLNSVIKELGAAQYLVTLLGDAMNPAWLPALTFMLGAVISFSTGTSWGTMAILMPLVIPVAVAMGETSGNANVLVPTIGAVLAGAVFGDHCSPISDTTIVSAVSSDCEPMAHVRTQLPYALLGAGLAVALGYLPAGFGVSPWWLLLAGGAACWAVIRYAAKPSS
jgi:Na+/H+ antiporter NhaC